MFRLGGAQEAPRLGRFESKEQHADRGQTKINEISALIDELSARCCAGL